MSQELRLAARHRERERELLRNQRREFKQDVATVASRPEGARFIRRLLDDGGIFTPGFRPDPEGAFLAGRRDAALRLWRILQECLAPEQFQRLVLGTGSVQSLDDPENEAAPEDEVDVLSAGDFF